MLKRLPEKIIEGANKATGFGDLRLISDQYLLLFG